MWEEVRRKIAELDESVHVHREGTVRNCPFVDKLIILGARYAIDPIE